MIRRLAILAVLSGTGALCVALAHGSPAPDRAWVRHTDPTGWSLVYPGSFHLEQAETGPGTGFVEVTIANFAPARGLTSWHSASSAGTDLAPPARPIPADGVAFRIWWFDGGPPSFGASPDSRFPLRLSDFTEPAPFDSVRPGRALGISADGLDVGGIVWIGRHASGRLRATLALIVGSLRFPRERPGTMNEGGSRVLAAPRHYPPGSFTFLPGPGLLCGGSPFRCTKDVVPLYLVHATWPVYSRSRLPCRSRACVPLGSFYAVEWWHINGYPSRCRLRADARREQFYCSNFQARWDRFGRALLRPRWAPVNRNLILHEAKVSWDGHVVVFIDVSTVMGVSP